MDWIYLDGFVDPPEPPNGYKIEVKYCEPMGFVYAYRFVRK
jgi:hypothetical protein